MIEAYNSGLEELNKGDAIYAAKRFNEAELLYPQSEWAPRASLMSAYSYFSQHYFNDAIIELERFLDKYDWCNVGTLRKHYPNAKIIGFIKEVWTGPAHDFNHPKHKSRMNFLNQCDGVIHNRPELKEFVNIQNELNVPMRFIAQPHNVEYFHQHYFKQKK